MKVRFKYEKNEQVKYVGHLDVMSMFDRVFRRCDIKLKFSQGFTQRSQIIFALPSSVGVISKCEYFEVEIPQIQQKDIQCIVEKLNKNLPNGFFIIDAYEVSEVSSIMSLVESAKYEMHIKLSEQDIPKVNNLFNEEKIFVKRLAKNGIEYDMNIRPYIIDANIEKKEQGVIIYIQLKSGSKENLKPDYIIQALQNYSINIIDYQIIKTNVLLSK